MNEMLNRLVGCSIEWGPGMIIAALMLFGIYRIVRDVALKFVDVGVKIVAALEKPAQALQLQAQSMEKLTNSLDDYVCRDRSEHREIMMLQKVILDRIEGLKHGQD
jgi:hypothetical protein